MYLTLTGKLQQSLQQLLAWSSNDLSSGKTTARRVASETYITYPSISSGLNIERVFAYILAQKGCWADLHNQISFSAQFDNLA